MLLLNAVLLPLGRPSSDPDPASGPTFYHQFYIIRSYKYLCLSTKCFPLCNNHIYMTKRTISSPLVDIWMAIFLFLFCFSLKWKAGEAHYSLNTTHPHPLLCPSETFTHFLFEQTNGLNIHKIKCELMKILHVITLSDSNPSFFNLFSSNRWNISTATEAAAYR